MMVGIIFVVVFARSDEPEYSGRLIGAQVADFAGRMTRDGQEEKSTAAGTFQSDSKPLVGLLIQKLVRFCGAQNVPIEPVRALRRFLFDGVEESAIVGGPGHTGDAFEA